MTEIEIKHFEDASKLTDGFLARGFKLVKCEICKGEGGFCLEDPDKMTPCFTCNGSGIVYESPKKNGIREVIEKMNHDDVIPDKEKYYREHQ